MQTLDVVRSVLEIASPLAIIGGGLWALFSYSSGKRSAAVRWTVDLFTTFYTDSSIRAARMTLEHRMSEGMNQVLDNRVLNPTIAVPETFRNDKADFDYMLNFLEQLLYLEKSGELSKEDRVIFFDYWISLLNRESNVSLRRYVCRKGFELLAGNVSTDHADHEHFAFYGTLRGGNARQEQLGIAPYLRYFDSTTVSGTAYELPTCPGFVVDSESGRTFEVQVFCVDKEHELFVANVIDHFERFNPQDPASSRFIRRGLFDKSLNVDFWIYEISAGGLVDALGEITDETWETFVARTQKALPESPPGFDDFPPALRREIQSRQNRSDRDSRIEGKNAP